MGRRAELKVVLLLAGLAGGCEGCQQEKPYNPFGVTSALSGAETAPPEGSAAALSSAKPEPGKFAPAVVAPAGSRKLRRGELVLEAPARYSFDRALIVGEGEALETVAWVKADPEARDVRPGMLVAFDAQGQRRQLATLPSFVPSAPGCSHTTRLEQTGPRSVLVDTVARCDAPLLARVPIQAVTIVAPGSVRPELFTLRLAAPASGEALSVSGDSSDRDGDGREDVRLTLTLTGPEGAQASASLVFLDRAAGVSRDATEPKASLLLGAKAALAKPGASALGEVDAQRRLLASLCAEGATARVFDSEGAPLRCDDLSPVVDTLARAEVLARLAAKDALGAASVLTRADWYYKRISADAEKSITKELGKRLLGISPSPSVLVARPKQVKGPHFSPLWFEADGSLLIASEAGLVRASRDGGTETALEAESGSVSWPLDVIDPSGRRLTGSLCACDTSEVQLALSDASGAPQTGLPTRLLSPRPGGCKARFSCPDPTPISATSDGFAVLLAGALLEPKKPGSALPSPGSPRSPDGKWLVSATPVGLVLQGPTPELWKLPEAPLDTRRAHDCVVSNDRAAVACVVDGKAVLFKRGS
ncbi:MAG TPA: hypothetical protein VIW29_01985 [Polyangiaceae bacterium]